MSKRQNLLKLSITLILIMALIVGILFVADISIGVKGGTIVEGGGSTDSRPAPFVDMPDSSGFVPVNGSSLVEAADITGITTEFYKREADVFLIETAAQFVYAFGATKNTNDKTLSGTWKFKLMNDFIITDATYLYDDKDGSIDLRLFLSGNVELDGNNKYKADEDHYQALP